MKKFVSILLLFIVQLVGICALSAMSPSSSTVLSSGTVSSTASSAAASMSAVSAESSSSDDKKESKEEKKLAQQSSVAYKNAEPMSVDLTTDESKMSADQLYDRGRCYQRGVGVGQDIQMAMQWFEKAADRGSAIAMCGLGEIAVSRTDIPVDEFAAGLWFTRAAENGWARAQCLLGMCFLFGFGGYAIDAKKAVVWLKKAVDNGDSTALVYLSHCYRYGLGVDKNEDSAAVYEGRAIEKCGKTYVQRTLTKLVSKKMGFEQETVYFCPRTCLDITCAICLEPLCAGICIQRCNNGHGCHAVCMERWKLRKGSRQCPSCRSNHIAEGKMAGEGDAVDHKTGYGTGLGCVIS